MDIVNINAFDLNDCWFQCLQQILEHGNDYLVDRGSFKGHYRKEFDYVTIYIEHPETRPLSPYIPEGLGINPPTSEDYIQQYFLDYLLNPSIGKNETYTYANRISVSINEVIRMFKEDGFGTNQAVMEIGMPSDIKLIDPPCLRLIDTRLRYGKLHFILYFRSWDLWGGFPSNLGGLQLVKQYMADEIGVESGPMIYSSKGLHLYQYVEELAKLRVGK